jgi:hypothetical protein
MTTPPCNKLCTGSRSGSVLVGALIFALVIATCLVSYLLLVQNSDQRVARAQRWNSALSLAEAGVEEALCQLNSGKGFTANGWGLSTNIGYGSLARTLGDGSYSVAIQLDSTGTKATIYSTGTITAPITKDLISRAVKVQAKNDGLFSVAMGAVTNITGKGNAGFATSSWNSHDTNNIQDLNGRYNGYLGTNGDTALVSGIAGMQNQNILGDLFLGPTATFSGSSAPLAIIQNWNGNFPDAQVPAVDPNGNGIYWLPPPTTVVGSGKSATTTYHFNTSGYYLVFDNYPIVVDPNVKVTLLVHPNSNPPNWTPSNITINGGTTNSGSITAYQEHGTVDLGTLGGAINNRPENFIFFGLPGLTNLAFGGSTIYIGGIYAPEAAIKLSGGGSGYNIVGSVVGKSIYLNGHYDIHYDDSLMYMYTRGFSPYSWEEL